ncbi:pyroglutamyl-peptidase I [Actinotalea sp. Marseille-Q4924]|uniref:pyroglutamyl-peptidase I n=1 Tax=Actinotalea sp. Marseille-Q4924 TaxID=2866571 RepID=UPI001CE3D8E7|nr:pyroglutamyl-peptidase I [Actinotalea sp. Marseille-Q4924]
MTRTVLVTGFEPFGGRPVNASWEAVSRLGRLWRGPEELVVDRLPVDFRAAPDRLRALIAEVAPDLVVCVGEAGGRQVVSVERVALNLVDARIPDNAGAAPVDEPVVHGGPTAYLSSLPVKACAEAVRATGVPAEVSHSAGTFVCNATSYALLHALEEVGPPGDAGAPGAVRGGFVHVPTALEGSADADEDAARLARALAAVVRAALDAPVDLSTSAGSLD